MFYKYCDYYDSFGRCDYYDYSGLFVVIMIIMITLNPKPETLNPLELQLKGLRATGLKPPSRKPLKSRSCTNVGALVIRIGFWGV